MIADKRALVLLNDLMFRVKIDEVLRRAGFSGEYLATADALLQAVRERAPEAIVLDLNHEAGHPLELITKLKSDAQTAALPVLGYVSHVQIELREQAQAAGCDRVVARSALTQTLPDFLASAAAPR